MLKLTYFKKLCWAARWFLPQKEAAEFIEDYRDMIQEVGEEGAREKFGPPIKAVLAVSNRREAVGWHLVLAAVLAILFMFVHWTHHAVFYPIAVLALAGVTAGLLFLLFGHGPWRNPFKGLPKRILIPAALLSALLLGLMGPIFFLPRILVSPYMFDEWTVVACFLRLCVAVFALAAGVGLILARLFDRRWRALVILSLTVICVCIQFLRLLYGMDPSSQPADHLFANSQECMFIVGAGFFTAGLSLC